MRLTIKDTQQKLKNKEITPRDVFSSFYLRIKERNKKINALLSIFNNAEKEMEKQNPSLPLYGAVFAIKDNILIKGERCTAGSKMLEDYIAPYSATVINKIKEKGGVVIGKTNMDEFAMGSSNETSAFGPVRNPYDLERVPGGSSGGSAAALADSMCNASLGSDTGGSVRQPAAFCGVTALKPTYGSVSRYGIMSMTSSLDQVGPFANTVEDVKLIFDVIRGTDTHDSVTTDINNSCSKKELTIGIPKEYFVEGIDKEVKDALQEAINKAKENRIKVVEISLPHTEYALPAYEIIMASEVSTNLARYDGIRYGLGAKDLAINAFQEAYIKNRGKGFGKEAKRRIMLGTYSLSSGYYDAYYIKAQKVRALIIDDFKKAFTKVDVILTPTTPTLPFKIGEKVQDPLTMHLSDIFTVPTSLAGLPALSLPCGERKGFPVGAQIIANRFCENTLFTIAEKLEKIWNN